MKKIKIAISLDQPLLDIINTKVDGSVIRSRSQAIEHFLKRGLEGEFINYTVIFIKGEHQKYSLQEINGKALIHHQLELIESAGISNVLIITQNSKYTTELEKEINKAKMSVKIIEKDIKGTGEALNSIKEILGKNDFIAMSGDVYNKFDLRKMINKHLECKKIATMGLMSRSDTKKFGTAVLNGDLIVDFKEKEETTNSNVVNSGIYIFSHEVFNYIDNETISLEKDLFPKLASLNQLVGFFTHGEYKHLEESE